MSEKDVKPEDATQPAKTGSQNDDARSQRLAAALKANLKRRKQQARGRREEGDQADTGER